MVIVSILFLISLVIFFFTLYVLSREDFVFLRKNVSVYDVFDIAVITFLFSLFFSRLCFVLFDFSRMYLNPLVFFLIPYFPGLSLTGGVLGAIVTIMVLTKRRKYPRGRFFDFFALGFLAVLPVISLGSIRGEGNMLFLSVLPVIYYTILLLFFLKILLPRFLQGQMRDGMLGFLILMNYALFSAIMVIVRAVNENRSVFVPELGVLAVLFLVSLFLYVRHSFPLQLRKG